VRQGTEDEAEHDVHYEHDDVDQYQRAEHVPSVAADQLAAAPERGQCAGPLDDDDRHDHRPDGDQEQTGHDDQEQPDRDRQASQDRGPGDGPEVRQGLVHGLADGQVGAAVSYVLHRLDQRRLQDEGGDNGHEGTEQDTDGAAGQRE
jgi:hypothetical protein